MTAGAGSPDALPAEVAAMARALGLASRGRWDAPPNPYVGAVLLSDGEVVGEGWTAALGGPHAEVRALQAAGPRALGATAVVTLEPCDHTGRTGPCSLALVEAGVARVVYGARDPGQVAGGGAQRLRDAGVEVLGGVLADWASIVHRTFLRDVETGRPSVTLKLAATADGAMALHGRRWITGPRARRRVHRLRADADAVLVGVGTVVADDPRLDVRDAPAPGGQPRPVVVDGRGRVPVDARVVRPGAIVCTTAAPPTAWREALTRRGVAVLVTGDGPRVDLGVAMAMVRDLDVTRILAEPGPTLAEALHAAGLVQRLVLHIAPDVADGPDLPTVPSSLWDPVDSTAWTVRELRPMGPDVEIVARP